MAQPSDGPSKAAVARLPSLVLDVERDRLIADCPRCALLGDVLDTGLGALYFKCLDDWCAGSGFYCAVCGAAL